MPDNTHFDVYVKMGYPVQQNLKLEKTLFLSFQIVNDICCGSIFNREWRA